MNDKKYKELVERLNLYIDDDLGPESVSPTLGSDGGVKTTSAPLFITKEMNVEKLSKNDVYLTHMLLHKFYARGGIKDLDKPNIEKLHKLIRVKFSHSDFDKLDKNDTNR